MLTNKRICVFVDGENFRHSINDLFPSFENYNYLPKADWTKFFDWISVLTEEGDSERVRTYWYVVQNIDFSPYNLNSKKEDYIFLERKFSENYRNKQALSRVAKEEDKKTFLDQMVRVALENQQRMEKRFSGWSTIHDTIAHKYKAIEFRKAGSIRYDLLRKKFGTEKAVDIKLATDLIKLKDIYDIAVIVSGDQDYVPAVDAIKDCGKHTVNVAFKTKEGKLLPGGARRLNQSTDCSIELEYDELKGYLGL